MRNHTFLDMVEHKRQLRSWIWNSLVRYGYCQALWWYSCSVMCILVVSILRRIVALSSPSKNCLIISSQLLWENNWESPSVQHMWLDRWWVHLGFELCQCCNLHLGRIWFCFCIMACHMNHGLWYWNICLYLMYHLILVQSQYRYIPLDIVSIPRTGPYQDCTKWRYWYG